MGLWKANWTEHEQSPARRHPDLYTIPLSRDAFFFMELEQEQLVKDWEAPFPMTVRTQKQLAQNEERVVSEGAQRLIRLLTADRPPWSF